MQTSRTLYRDDMSRIMYDTQIVELELPRVLYPVYRRLYLSLKTKEKKGINSALIKSYKSAPSAYLGELSSPAHGTCDGGA